MKAAIFDMDGTIMDSMWMWDSDWPRLLQTKSYDDAMEDIHEIYKHHPDIKPKPYAKEYLEKLKNQGVFLALATLTDRPLAESALKRFDLLKYFDFIKTVREAGFNKDNATLYEDCLAASGCFKYEAVVFEDVPYCLKSAHDAGFITCAVRDNNRKSLAMDSEFIAEYCDMYIKSYKELL